MNYNNQNYNNFNNSNQAYQQASQGYNSYNQGYPPNNFDNNQPSFQNGPEKRGGRGIFGILFALVALVILVYFLLHLLGIDVLDYVEKYLPDLNNKTEEKAEDKKEEPTPKESPKKSVKESLEGLCINLDNEGNYNYDVIDEKSLEGNFIYCKDKTCFFSAIKSIESKKETSSKNKEETSKEAPEQIDINQITYDKDTIYSYNCNTKIYIEKPSNPYINEQRADIVCDKYNNQLEPYQKELEDKTKISCLEGICTISSNGKIVSKNCNQANEETNS